MGVVQDRRVDEAPLTLTTPAPRTLGLLDQLGFWGNVGVSMLGFAGALAVLTPYGADPLSLPAAIAALVVGTALGSVALGATLVMGARTGAPAMVLLRGLLGARASWVPTVLNLAQCVGWAVFELVIIAQGLTAITDLPHWAAVLVAGVVTTGLTIRPLGAIRLLRRYVSVLVVIALVVLLIGLARRPVAAVQGSWSGFWLAVDAIVAIGISWVPLGADYSRHARSERAAFLGGALGYGVTQVLCMLMGVLALAQVQLDGARIVDLFLTLPLGVLAVAVLVLRETDLSFANVYSTAVSIQNLAPGWDRRVLSTAIGVGCTLVAMSLDITQYTSFLYLLGGVFIPLAGALIGAWARGRGAGWDVSDAAPSRPVMWVAWAAGFVVYQLVNPGTVPGWSAAWTALGTSLHTLGHPWVSASITSFVVAAGIAVVGAGRGTVAVLAPGSPGR